MQLLTIFFPWREKKTVPVANPRQTEIQGHLEWIVIHLKVQLQDLNHLVLQQSLVSNHLHHFKAQQSWRGNILRFAVSLLEFLGPSQLWSVQGLPRQLVCLVNFSQPLGKIT